MKILKPTRDNIKKAADVIMNGFLVVMPTETVYGLAANVFNPEALARVFEVKNRPYFDPLIVHIADYSTIEILTCSPNKETKKLIDAFWPGPLTMIFPKKDVVPDLATSGLPTVAIRFPSHNVACDLIKASSGALAAPSANSFGFLSPTRIEHVISNLGNKVDYLLDGGSCEIGVESTIIDITSGTPVLLRPGGVSTERIREVAGELIIKDWSSGKPVSPGQLPSHYAPRTDLHIFSPGEIPDINSKKRKVIIFFSDETFRKSGISKENYVYVEYLSRSGDLLEAAARLFSVLHEVDGVYCDEIWMETVPENGIGRAINDRIFRASCK